MAQEFVDNLSKSQTSGRTLRNTPIPPRPIPRWVTYIRLPLTARVLNVSVTSLRVVRSAGVDQLHALVGFGAFADGVIQAAFFADRAPGVATGRECGNNRTQQN